MRLSFNWISMMTSRTRIRMQFIFRTNQLRNSSVAQLHSLGVLPSLDQLHHEIDRMVVFHSSDTTRERVMTFKSSLTGILGLSYGHDFVFKVVTTEE